MCFVETKSNPITGLDRPEGLQEFEAPRFQDNRHMKVVSLSALRTGLLYPKETSLVLVSVEDRGSTVVKVLHYKQEGRWFDPSWCSWNFSLTYFFRSHYGPGVDSASNRNEYQEYFLQVKCGR